MRDFLFRCGNPKRIQIKDFPMTKHKLRTSESARSFSVESGIRRDMHTECWKEVVRRAHYTGKGHFKGVTLMGPTLII